MSLSTNSSVSGYFLRRGSHSAANTELAMENTQFMVSEQQKSHGDVNHASSDDEDKKCDVDMDLALAVEAVQQTDGTCDIRTASGDSSDNQVEGQTSRISTKHSRRNSSSKKRSSGGSSLSRSGAEPTSPATMNSKQQETSELVSDLEANAEPDAPSSNVECSLQEQTDCGSSATPTTRRSYKKRLSHQQTLVGSETISERQANETMMNAYIEKFSNINTGNGPSTISGCAPMMMPGVDLSHRPGTLQEAICMYIDYLMIDNELRTRISDCAVACPNPPLDFHREEYFRDVMCRPVNFPTARFRDWLKIYNVDIEITDPDGHTVTQTTFGPPSAVCENGSISVQQPGRPAVSQAVPWSNGALPPFAGVPQRRHSRAYGMPNQPVPVYAEDETISQVPSGISVEPGTNGYNNNTMLGTVATHCLYSMPSLDNNSDTGTMSCNPAVMATLR